MITRRSAIGLGAGAVLFGMPQAHAAANAGIVESVRGEASAEGVTPRRWLGPTADVFLNDTVRTGDSSRIAMKLGSTTLVRLGPNARFRIDRYVVDAGGTFLLDPGAMLLDRPDGVTKENTTVRTPFGLIAVRGTRFFAGPSNGVFGVFVARGEVRVTAGGETVRLRENEGTNIAVPGAKPTPPAPWGAPRIAAALASVQ